MSLLLKIKAFIHSKRKSLVPKGFVDPVQFQDSIAEYRRRGVSIGEKVRLLGRIDGINPHLVSIGDYCVIGANSALLAHCPIKGAKRCKIGNFVYLAYGVLVLPGVEIGDNCIVGAGSVVTKSMPANSIIAGNPARVLRPITKDEKVHLRDVMLNDRLFGWDSRESET